MEKLARVSLLGADSRTATANGTGVDVSGYTREAIFILDCEAGSGTSPTNDVKIQDSDDNSTFADVSGLTFTQVTDAAASHQKISTPADGLRKYVRAVSTLGGTSPVFVSAVVGVFRQRVQS